jgi:hypothetical protein
MLRTSLCFRLFLLLFPIAYGCDRFFTIDVKVLSCDSGQPVVGAEAVLSLDKGFGEPDQTAVTGSSGELHMVINEPPSSWATLTITAPDYEQSQLQFQGSPQAPLSVCLHPKTAMPTREP